MSMTKLTNLIDPEVMGDMISATLPKKLKFARIARIDDTLEGQPGSTIKVPKYGYIGDAEDVAEGIAMGTTTLTATTQEATVKKAGKAVEITDEAVLSGYGDPAAEAGAQLTMSIASKVDNDCVWALCGTKLVYEGETAPIGYNGVVDANALFLDESDNALTKVMYIHPLQEATLRKDPNFMDKNKYGLEVVMNGTIGRIAGCEVVKSKRVKHVIYDKDNSGGTITIVDAETNEDGTHIHLETALAGYFGNDLKVGDKVKPTVGTKFFANPIVIVDKEDPNEDPDADAFSTEAPALTIYIKRETMVESDRDILKKTTVTSADKHFVATLSNESKAVLAKFGEEA